MKYECPECSEEVDGEDVEFECPFCGETDMGEGFYRCESCGTLFNHEGDLWICEFCDNEETTFTGGGCEVEYCPGCGEVLEDPDYCYYCGWPNNQGWIGEHYG